MLKDLLYLFIFLAVIIGIFALMAEYSSVWYNGFFSFLQSTLNMKIDGGRVLSNFGLIILLLGYFKFLRLGVNAYLKLDNERLTTSVLARIIALSFQLLILLSPIAFISWLTTVSWNWSFPLAIIAFCYCLLRFLFTPSQRKALQE